MFPPLEKLLHYITPRPRSGRHQGCDNVFSNVPPSKAIPPWNLCFRQEPPPPDWCPISESLDIFRRRLKTELFERSYNWHRACQTTLLLRDSLSLSRSFLLWLQPWSRSTIMLVWHSFLIIIIIIIIIFFLPVRNYPLKIYCCHFVCAAYAWSGSDS